MRELKIGEKIEIRETVTEEKLACNVGSGSLRVYATPMVAALMEKAAAALAQEFLNEELTTVGVMISIEHISPTPLGGEVTAAAVLTGAEGRTFDFEIKAFDNCGEIARGTHRRFSVKSISFQQKADNKLEK